VCDSDILSVRATCRRLRDIIKVRPVAVIREHAGLFESMKPDYETYLRRLPKQLCTAVMQPRSLADMQILCSLNWPALKTLRIYDTLLNLVRASFLTSLPLLTSLESLSLWHTVELADDVFEVVEQMVGLTALQCSTMWRLPPQSLSRLVKLTNLRSLQFDFCMSGYAGVVSTTCDGDAVMSQLRLLTSLRSLTINSIELLKDELAHLSSLTRLCELRLAEVALHKPASLAHLSALGALDVLAIGYGASQGVVSTLAMLPYCVNLVITGQSTAAEWSQLTRLRPLRSLHLRRIDGASCKPVLNVLRAWGGVMTSSRAMPSSHTASSLTRVRASMSSLIALSSSSSSSSSLSTAWQSSTEPEELCEFSVWLDEGNDLIREGMLCSLAFVLMGCVCRSV
jgi:hypothetical protein